MPTASTTNRPARRRADEPELLADDREDVVVVGLGQPRPLRLRVAEADAEHAAGGERPHAVHGCQQTSWYWLESVHPDSQALMRSSREADAIVTKGSIDRDAREADEQVPEPDAADEQRRRRPG